MVYSFGKNPVVSSRDAWEKVFCSAFYWGFEDLKYHGILWIFVAIWDIRKIYFYFNPVGYENLEKCFSENLF